MRRILVGVSLILTCTLVWAGGTVASGKWKQLEHGIEIRVVEAQKLIPVGDSQILVIRLDPQYWQLVFVGISNTNEAHGLTAREWCKQYGLRAAINAGMFNRDHKTHTGFLQSKNHTNSGGVNEYQSVAAFDPRYDGIPAFRIFDLDAPGISIEVILKDYMTVIQNLRLIKRPGENRWSQQERRWSEAALGEDKEGRILFIFSRSPFTMHDLNQELLSAGIGIVAAQHLEGGPEAQLYLEAGGEEIDVFGSYETGFREDDSNGRAWPVPNVLGIQPRK